MNEQTAKLLVAALELLRRSVSDNTTANLSRLQKIEEMATGANIPGWATAAAAAGVGASVAGGAASPGRDMRPNPDLDAAMGFGPAPSPAAARPTAHQRPVRVETMRVTVAKMLAMGSQIVVAGQAIPLAAGGGMLALPPAQSQLATNRQSAPLATGGPPPAVKVLGFTANQPGASGSGGGKQPPPPPAGAGAASPRDGASGGGGSITGLLVRLFGRVIVPLVALHAVLSQTTSGFGIFQKALSVFASAVAPILLPVFMLLAAGIVAASDVIWRELLPQLREWYGFILKTAIPAFEQLVKAVQWAARALRIISGGGSRTERMAKGEFGAREAREEITGVFGERGGQAADWLRDRTQWLRDAVPDSWLPPSRPTQAGNAAATPGRAGGTSGQGTDTKTPADGDAVGGGSAGQPSVFQRALSDVTRSLQMSIGPKSSYTGLTEVGKQAQLAALNQDPLDARVLRQSIEAIKEFLGAIRDNTGRAADKPVFPTGGR